MSVPTESRQFVTMRTELDVWTHSAVMNAIVKMDLLVMERIVSWYVNPVRKPRV